MERIRKALDLAGLERSRAAAIAQLKPVLRDKVSETAAAPVPPQPKPETQYPETPHPEISKPAPPGSGLPAVIAYTETKVFAATREVFEANRIMDPGSHDPGAVAFRMLRTQVLQRMEANKWRSLAIFSPGAQDGKTTTAINLAVSIANDHRHTALLVDFDFKRPTLAARFGFEPELGSDDVLRGNARIEEALYHPDAFDRLVVMPARAAMSHSSEILAGPRSRELIKELRARYPERIIICDLPPVLSADDALAFAPLVECGLVVASEGRTRRSDLLRTIELLQQTPIVGTVLNRAADAATGK
jgi:protein-tyrosine kinase